MDLCVCTSQNEIFVYLLYEKCFKDVKKNVIFVVELVDGKWNVLSREKNLMEEFSFFTIFKLSGIFFVHATSVLTPLLLLLCHLHQKLFEKDPIVLRTLRV